MGIEPFLIASAVTASFAQRLARRICVECREAYQPVAEELAEVQALIERLGLQIPADFLKTLYRGKGCPACRFTGFRGRLLLAELATLSAPLRSLILRKAAMDELQTGAMKLGMEPMLLDGLHKAKAGLTSLAEVVRVAAAGE
jgi:type II secretory ATPase GspE/PulE/Tfp pilus assembly ATPase PilB-like protein